MRLDNILKKLCQTWNPKVLFPKSPNSGTISNDYT